MIPSLHYERPIYFDYALSSPTSIINIDQEYEWYLFDLPFESIKQSESSLKPNELYDITINLHIPSKQSMHDIGNVMLKLSLYSCTQNDNKIGNEMNHKQPQIEYLSTDKYQVQYGWHLLRKSTRPILLKYESTLIRMIKKIVCIVPYTLGLWEEHKYLQIPIMSAFAEMHDNPTCAAVVHLSTKQFNVYDASIYFDIQLQGIEYFLYHWWVTSSLLTVLTFTFICCIASSPAMILCCYQVNTIRDCYNNQSTDDDEEEQESIVFTEEEDADVAPISMFEDIQSATVTTDDTEIAPFQSSLSSSVQSTSSVLLTTASLSPQTDGNDDSVLNNQNESGLRRRIKTEKSDEYQ